MKGVDWQRCAIERSGLARQTARHLVGGRLGTGDSVVT